MELPCLGTYMQENIHCKIEDWMWHVHAALRHEIIPLWLQNMYLQLRFNLKAAGCLSGSRAKTVQIGCESSLTKMSMTSAMS